MPKLKPSKTEMRRREVRAIIVAGCARQGMQEEELFERMGLSENTMYNRRKKPEGFKLDELWRLADILRLSDDDRLALMGGVGSAVT